MTELSGLRETIQTQRERIRQLEDQLIPSPEHIVRPEWKLSPLEAKLFSHLTTRDVVSKENVMDVLYGDRIDGPPATKIIDVLVYKLRAKLAPFGIQISTFRGQGIKLENRAAFQLPPRRSDREALRDMLLGLATQIHSGDTTSAKTSINSIIAAIEGSSTL